MKNSFSKKFFQGNFEEGQESRIVKEGRFAEEFT
jgi:hypothetical protein